MIIDNNKQTTCHFWQFHDNFTGIDCRTTMLDVDELKVRMQIWYAIITWMFVWLYMSILTCENSRYFAAPIKTWHPNRNMQQSSGCFRRLHLYLVFHKESFRFWFPLVLPLPLTNQMHLIDPINQSNTHFKPVRDSRSVSQIWTYTSCSSHFIGILLGKSVLEL
jgi:hypothetical protein